jgi:hypothetical protein
LNRLLIPGTIQTIGRLALPPLCQVIFPWPEGSPEMENWKQGHKEAFENLYGKV